MVHRKMNTTDKEFVNKRSEIEGTCRHKTTFHRLWKEINSTMATDEHTIICKKSSDVKNSIDILYVRTKVRAYHLCHICFRFGAGF